MAFETRHSFLGTLSTLERNSCHWMFLSLCTSSLTSLEAMLAADFRRGLEAASVHLYHFLRRLFLNLMAPCVSGNEAISSFNNLSAAIAESMGA